MSEVLPKIIVVVGPTASGKTALALELARKFDGEIINADSRQVYAGMDIATAKSIAPDIEHHLFDLIDPDEPFSVAEYQAVAFGTIDDILARGKLPILVGGTGLYVRTVLENLQLPDVAPDPELRAELELLPLDGLLRELDRRDPETGKVIQRSNKRRVIRALEVVRKTGKSFLEAGTKGPRKYDALVLGLNPDREVLKERIARRVDELVQAGLVDEARQMIDTYDAALPSMSGLGYPEMRAHLEDGISLEEAKELLVKNTADYARRQMTWFKKMSDIHWISDTSEAAGLLQKFIS